MRQISKELKDKLNSGYLKDIQQKILLYRRKWVEGGTFTNSKPFSQLQVGDKIRKIVFPDVMDSSMIPDGISFSLLDESITSPYDTLALSTHAGTAGVYIHIRVDAPFVQGEYIWRQPPAPVPGEFQPDFDTPYVNWNLAAKTLTFKNPKIIVKNMSTLTTFNLNATVFDYDTVIKTEFIIEETPIDITDAITHKNTNAIINNQLDTEQANVWKIGNLSLILKNEKNRFWQGKEDGLFPAPYIIYGSKIEYYIGIDKTKKSIIAQSTGFCNKLTGEIIQKSGTGNITFGKNENGSYFRFDGSQAWFDLGFKPTNKTKFKIKASYPKTASRFLMGSRIAYMDTMFNLYLWDTGQPRVDWGNSTTLINSLVLNTKPHTFIIDKNKLYIDNELQAISADIDFEVPFTLTVGANNQQSGITTSGFFIGDVYDMEYWENDVLIGNWVAVEQGQEIILDNIYEKQFTGYLTEFPNYRQDNGLVELRALNRLDWLKNISAEDFSFKRTQQQLIRDLLDFKINTTPDVGVGRIWNLLKGTSLSTAVSITEKADYSVSDMNIHDKSAKIELKIPLLSTEYLWADYIYWKKDMLIHDIIKELVNIGDIEKSYIEDVIFENAARIFFKPAWNIKTAWHYDINSNGDLKFASQLSGSSNTNWLYGTVDFFKVKFSKGTLFARQYLSNSIAYAEVCMCKAKESEGYCIRRRSFSADSNGYINTYISVWKIDASGNRINVVPEIQRTIHSTYDTTYAIGFSDTMIFLYEIRKLYSGTYAEILSMLSEYTYRDFNFVYITAGNSELYFSTETAGNVQGILNIFNSGDFYKNPKINMTYQNQASDFKGWTGLRGVPVIVPTVNPIIRVKNDLNIYTQVYLESIFNIQNPTFDCIISNDILSNGITNKYEINNLELAYLGTQNIKIGLINLLNMSVFDAIKELASMPMYEIGFDADDKFFFRRRKQLSSYKEIKDNEIIEMSGISIDIDRIKTRVVVGYGDYNRIIDSDTLNEPRPNNKDKFGVKIYEISGGQLLPEDNVDLAYAIAPTVYEELSKERLSLSVDKVIDLELELGDYIRNLHNNNIFSNKNDSDYQKWKDIGTYFLKCKVVGIRTDFNKKTTSLDLLDYTDENDKPLPD